MGDAGATALADALQATVLTCETQRSRNVHLVATDVALQGGLSSWRRRVVVQFVLLFFSCVSKENVAWRGVLFASCSKVDVALFQNRTGLIECLVIGICLVAVHHIVSSGPWRRLASNKRDVVCQGHDMPRQDMALRLEETSRTVDTIQHVVARDNVLLLLF